MKLNSQLFALTATILVSAPVLAQQPATTTVAQSTGQVTLGAARFTVISPLCIRMEYAPNNGFVDTPTLFAINRTARDAKAKIKRTATEVTIETSAMRLVYRPDGKPFSASNLKVTFRNGKQAGNWQPGQENTGNLGGPVATLDFTSGPINLPNGLVSRDGWSMVDDSGRAIRTNGWIAPRPGGGPPTENIPKKNQDLDWYFFAYGQNYLSVLQSLATISGRAAMPRRELLGSWNSRWAKLSSDDYRQMVREYEEHDFPLDIVVMDMEWHTQNAREGLKWADNLGWTGYTWDKKLIPDPPGLLQEFQKKGLHVTLNDHPHDGIRDHEEMYPQFMESLGLSPKEGKNLPFLAGDKAYMDAFFAASHAPLEKQGVDFWWLDWQQDSLVPWVSGVPGLRHLPWLNELYYQHTEKEGLRGQTYSRWGGWGDQRHPVQFSGDTTSNWEVLGFEVPFSATSGNGGCFYWAHDTGGFFGSRNAEQYTRWTQFSGLSAALRVHSAGEDRRPWLWGKQYEEAMRTTYRLRSELFPYIYTSVRQAYDEMKPLLRPSYLLSPNIEAAYHNPGQYFYGDNLVVAPIVAPGIGPGHVAKQSLWFPKGQWYNYFTGEQYQAGKEGRQVLVTADINETPIFVRGGVPLPMQPYTQRMTSAPLQQLRVRCYPGEAGATGTYSLYEDDGRSSQYQQGNFARTPLSYTRSGNSATVKIGPTVGHFNGQLTSRSFVVELPATSAATKVMVQSGTTKESIAPQYDAATQTNRIVVPARAINQQVTVTVNCSPVADTLMRERATARRVEGITGKAPMNGTRGALLEAAKAAPVEQQQMLLATLGIGTMKHMVGRNFRDNPKETFFYAPKGLLSGNGLQFTQRSGASRMGKMSDDAIELTDTYLPRTAPILGFQVDGQPFQLTLGTGPLFSKDNVALDATVTASSTEGGYKQDAVIDGLAEGYPNNAGSEWSSNGGKAGTTIKLNWTTPQTIDRVVLYDRPNTTDDVTSGILTFSDGSSLNVGALSGDGTTVTFPAKTVTWVNFEVTGIKPGTVNAGLSEFAVFKAK